MFNLNDPRWGEAKSPSAATPTPNRVKKTTFSPGGQRPQGPNQGPPDLDELWRDFNRKLGGLLGGKSGGNRGGNGGGTPGFNPSPKSAGIGAGLIGLVALLIWLGTGFFIVQEGQQAVITRFGKYSNTVGGRYQLAHAVPDRAP